MSKSDKHPHPDTRKSATATPRASVVAVEGRNVTNRLDPVPTSENETVASGTGLPPALTLASTTASPKSAVDDGRRESCVDNSVGPFGVTLMRTVELVPPNPLADAVTVTRS